MARKFIKKTPRDLEDIVVDSVKRVGLDLNKQQSALLLRLIMSGIAHYFYVEPDSLVDVGFMRFKKSPDKEEMFAMEILRNEGEGVVNADTLWRYYKGELATESELKNILDGFMTELLNYAQIQEMNTMNVTSKLTRKRK